MDDPVARTDIEKALRAARSYDGLRPRKLVDSPLLKLPIVKKQAAVSGTALPVAAAAVIRMKVEALGDGIRARALASAFNFDGRGADFLGDRRRAFHNIHGVSVDTIVNYENAAIEDLIEDLFGEDFSEVTVGEVSHEVAGTAPASSEAFMDNAYYHWRALRVDSTYIFEAGRTPERFEVVRDMEALRQTDRCVVRFRWSGGGEPRLVIDEGGQLVRRLPSSVWGFTLHEVDVQQVFAVGEPHRLRYHVEIDPSSDEPQPFVSYSPTERVPEFVQRIAFGDEVPHWIYRIVAPFADFPYAATSRDRAFVGPNGRVETTFEQLEPGLSYGFWWEWQ